MKPSREPDFIFNNHHFYFKEMIQINLSFNRLFKIRVNNGKLQYKATDIWRDYSEQDRYFTAYMNWLAERELLADDESDTATLAQTYKNEQQDL